MEPARRLIREIFCGRCYIRQFPGNIRVGGGFVLWNNRRAERLFDQLCETWYEKVLHYLYFSLRDEQSARDAVQEVFLIAWKKRLELLSHPNPGGFLFQTAKHFVCKARREGFRRLDHEPLTADGELPEQADGTDAIEQALDRAIDENAYIEAVLSRLSADKRTLYELYYLQNKPMAEIASAYGLEEPAVRMRYVRLCREIRTIAAQVAEENFLF